MHEDFVATLYPQVHESLKLTTKEHVHIENPPSSSETLSSTKNLGDAFTFGDQFLNDKSLEDEPGKTNVETEVKSMVTVPIHQASSLAPPLSTPIIDLTPPKPVSPLVQETIFTVTTATKTTLLPPPPPQQQNTIDSKLATRVSALEKICANFEKKTKLQDKTTQALSSRVYMLENHDLYSKIDKYVNEVVKEAVHNALQAPLRERFRDLFEFEMKEILHDRMFESGSYRSYPEHTALYDALKLFMDHEKIEEFKEATVKSRKRCRDDQDPPPPPPIDSDQSKNKRHDSDALASKQPPVQKSSAWKTSNTREAPSSSSKQKSASPSEQPVDDVPIPNDVHLLDSEDIGVAYLPKIKTIPNWLTLVPEEETPKTPEPDWVIPPNKLPETEINCADALAKTYKDLEEYKLLRKTRDIGSFIKWYCKQIGKSKLVKANLEGPAYKLVKPFHKNNISLQFQMEECHLLLTDQNNLMNPEGDRVVHDISKPLPLGGPPGQVTIQTQYLFNKDLEYLVLGEKERRNALSISKLKAAYYPDFGLEELVPSLWIESECDYDISAAYGISHWWFKSKEFYITRHSAHSDRNAVRSHMRILSVVSLKTFSRYGYTYLREIVLRKADYKE
ncbi:hypothetical protein Tco_1205101 [Tanacetum coccineum]